MTCFERGAARRVNRPAALTAAARELRVEPAVLQAVFKSETPHGSFWKNGVLKCLVEKHVVYRHLPRGKRAEAVRLALATTNWRHNNYRKEQRTWQQRYALLERIADAYGVEVACKSASWGGSQIMGGHHAKLGYGTAYEMYRAFADHEQAHIDGFIDYLKAFKMVRALQAKDWETIALRYNGRGQVKAYSAKMRHHYKRSRLPKEILPYKARPPRQKPAPAGRTQPIAKRGLLKFILDLIASLFGRK